MIENHIPNKHLKIKTLTNDLLPKLKRSEVFLCPGQLEGGGPLLQQYHGLDQLDSHWDVGVRSRHVKLIFTLSNLISPTLALSLSSFSILV